MLGKSLNPVHIQFNRVRAEYRQTVSGDVVRVLYPVQFWIFHVEPFGFLPAGNEVDTVHPRREFLHAAEPVTQKSVVAVALLTDIYVTLFFFWSVFIKLYKLVSVTSVNPRENKIHGIVILAIFRFTRFFFHTFTSKILIDMALIQVPFLQKTGLMLKSQQIMRKK